MKTNTSKKVTAIVISLVFVIIVQLSGCALLKNEIHEFKGSLIGTSYEIEFFDNYGAKFLDVSGEKISLEGNYTKNYNSEGNGIYELSSVVTVTIDGNNMETTGSTVVFADKKLNKLEDFSISEIDSESNGISSITSLSRNINALKNAAGTSKIILIQSQMGVPICAYGGDDVYWEISDDLPKTTKLMVDGKPLYVHRANYVILDTNLLD